MTTEGTKEDVHLLVDDDTDLDGGNGPVAKRLRCDLEAVQASEKSIKDYLRTFTDVILDRLDEMDEKFNNLFGRVKMLEDQITDMDSPESNIKLIKRTTPSTVIVGMQQGNKSGQSIMTETSSALQMGPNVTLITLNTAQDYPNGVWLGDENNPEMRVRVPVTPSDLLHIHSNCRTAEKTALTLLDYLFDRDTQSASNLSGLGKHGKKQLDPLMIYGIRCHLLHRFRISESDWHRIRQNIDSKCRTAFRRKTRGQPLTVKAFRGKAPNSYGPLDDSLEAGETPLHIHQQEETVNLTQSAIDSQQMMVTQHGEVQIIQATAEQIAQLREAHNIQLIDSRHVLEQLKDDQGDSHDGQIVSMTQPLQVVSSDGTTEVIQIARNSDVTESMALLDSDQVILEQNGQQVVIQAEVGSS